LTRTIGRAKSPEEAHGKTGLLRQSHDRRYWEGQAMHLSTHNWMRAEPLETTLKRIRQFGYESIEISGEPEQYETKETRRLLKEYGIRCWGAVTLMLGERNLAARDQGQRERSVQYVKDVLTLII
jgi:sugar phosphate isomerase/epimerase